MILLVQQIVTLPGAVLAAREVESMLGRKWTCGLNFIISAIFLLTLLIPDESFEATLVLSAMVFFFNLQA